MRLSHESDIESPAIDLCYRAIEEPQFSPQSLAIALALKNELTNDFLQELSTYIPMGLILSVTELKKSWVTSPVRKTLKLTQAESVYGLCRVWGMLMQQSNSVTI